MENAIDDVLSEVAKADVSNLPKSEWHARFAYVSDGDSYFDLVGRKEYARSVFNALYRHEPNLQSIHAERRIDPALWFDENRRARGGYTLQGVTFAAGDENLVSRNGEVFGNRWKNARPKGRPGDARLWLEHVERMIPDAMEREHVLSVMAFKRQNPNRKINHAVLHGGAPGSGKDTMWAPFIWSIGGPRNANVEVVRHEELLGQWGYALESEVLVVNELRQHARMDKRGFENTLKPLIAAPPEFLQVNRKGMHPYYAVNRLLMLAFSNERAAISLPADDRRWFVIWSDGGRMAESDAIRIWNWYQAGGFEIVADYLDQRDVAAFNPGMTPPTTDAKLALVELALNHAESYVQNMAENKVGEFARGVISTPLNLIALRIIKNNKDAPRVNRESMLVALKQAGWLDRGMCASRKYPNKRHLYCHPDFINVPKSELRNMVEQPVPVTLTVVK